MEICVAICTYQRSSLRDTLESLAKQSLSEDITLKVLVADNDKTNKAKDTIEAWAEEFGLNLRYVHAPSQNISIARNACLDNVDCDWMASIDDDEIASVYWLSNLYKKAQLEKAAVVCGPVKAIYQENAPAWMKECDFHSQHPVYVKGVIQTTSTANALIHLKHPACAELRFDLSLGKSGGEDSSYFSSVYSNGGNITFASDALVTEAVPLERANLMWLLKRKFRFGQTCGARVLKHKFSFKNKIKYSALAICKFTFCLFMCLMSILGSDKKYKWLLRGTLHFGVLAKLLGKNEITQY